ncbi:TetR/AcrR family transcriptional regulator [Ferdinandcohnia quinoae]|uniref:TetR/AcrR family transcriptional regulator n=1 Tax=Fredinandcohnia quinoae TaxID=2918902 RepID=A0AAW5ED09_9BACI|nr:TetR/AcrR family transcriptional regulator [Fredinandcohnia sp. SECRCQ15]MCH1627951.1 TetR/AcrR family transcriptional regulator [Fredinandcohnia sp. SECRCQ15]
MNERKQHVIKKAHQLFLEKGFQATSVQDILDYSGISKGTFYNYFPSKSELFKAVFNTINAKYEKERDALLIGENLTDMEVFIKQIHVYIQSNKRNKLFSLVEEVFVSNDPDLKQFVKRAQLNQTKWIYDRFLELFGHDKQPYLLDCTVIFSGILHHMFHYNHLNKESKYEQIDIIRYCLNRVITIVNDLNKVKVQLLQPDLLTTWLPDSTDKDVQYRNEFYYLSAALKKIIMKVHQNEPERVKYLQLLDFIQEELMNNKLPRQFLIESALHSLKLCPELQQTEELVKFQELLYENVLNDY